MDDDYPDEVAVKTIREWPHTRPWSDMLDLVKRNWNWADMMFNEVDGVYYLSTGGWSGNEELIDVMRSNFLFWSQCWISSRRGGHFLFSTRTQSLGGSQ